MRQLAALLVALAASPAAALAPVPPLAGPVVDAAGLLDEGSVARLDALARAARAGGGGQGVQLQFLVVPSLEGEAIEDYSMRVAEAWKIGTKGRDDGVLVTVARDDRAVRIEVGGGLEGGLTDAQSSRIIRGTIVPAFREGRYGEGLYDAGVQILSALGSLPQDVRASGHARRRGITGFAGAYFPVLVVFFVIANVLRGFGVRRRRHLWMGGGPWMGGGFGGGGGGWSGGGGGFSGGGASGRW